MFDTDEHVRADATLEGMAKLQGRVHQGERHGHRRQRVGHQRRRGGGRADGEIGGGEEGPEADGAARRLRSRRHRSRRSWASGPVSAVKRALAKAGLKLDQMDVIESNEAFAAQALGVSQGTRHRSGEGQPERRRGRARPSDRRDRRDPHGQGDVRAAPHRRPLRARHDVHRRRPGHRRDHRARLTSSLPAGPGVWLRTGSLWGNAGRRCMAGRCATAPDGCCPPSAPTPGWLRRSGDRG